LLALAIACLRAAWHLGQYLVVEYRMPIVGDEDLYFGVGRGILNGLKPYADLYESKPPGVFLLAALSLWLTGGNRLYVLAHILAIAGLPFSLLVFSLRRAGNGSRCTRVFLGVLGFLFGCGLALYASYRSGGYQTEAFGALFGVLYVLLVAGPSRPPSWQRTGLAAACLLGALGMKEPFLFSLLAAALFLAEDLRWLVRNFALPLGIALAAGVVALGALGYLKPYLTIYLPDILAGRFPATRTYLFEGMGQFKAPNPLWLRGFSFMKVLADIQWEAPYPLVWLPVVGLWLVRPLLGARAPRFWPAAARARRETAPDGRRTHHGTDPSPAGGRGPPQHFQRTRASRACRLTLPPPQEDG
jgi:hypothetical protein